jgi:hypothetical protein
MTLATAHALLHMPSARSKSGPLADLGSRNEHSSTAGPME